MKRVAYRIGLSTLAVNGTGIGRPSMCLEEAPAEWHSVVLDRFVITVSGEHDDTWPRACEYSDPWILRWLARELENARSQVQAELISCASPLGAPMTRE